MSWDYQIFGTESNLEDSNVVLIPVPWEVTASYGSGTSTGPELIHKASVQVDLFDIEFGNAYKAGYYMLPLDSKLKKNNDHYRTLATQINESLHTMQDLTKEQEKQILEINEACVNMNTYVYETARQFPNKILGVVGGDHSTPYGLIKFLSEKYQGNFGILHIDAHLDLRDAFFGFNYSHASIMNNVMKLPHAPRKIVQFGIRDFCEEEVQFMKEHEGRFATQYDLTTKNKLLAGESWLSIAEKALSELPDNVYISFDIDGMDPTLCPQTGTPVPGGLSYEQTLTLFSTLKKLNKKIIGFDLVEVSGGESNNEWNGNVGARMLFKLCGWSVKTNNIL